MVKILIVDDNPGICSLLARTVDELGYESAVVSDCKTALDRMVSFAADVVLLDLNLPDGSGLDLLLPLMSSASAPEVVIITGTGDLPGAELAFDNGAWDYIQKPFRTGDVKLTLTRALAYRHEKQRSRSSKWLHRDEIIGDSPQLKTCLEQVAKAAEADINVLITGETGTGKELLARTIHRNSPVGENNFVVVDCAALPETLVESTLFGHVKGAFTGAEKSLPGLVKQADGGTLFLDEVGELPPSVQKSFLRVLQEQRFRPVGGKHEAESHFRLIGATHRDLDSLVAEGRFRSDLLFRLRTLTIHIPPLRERQADVHALVLHTLSRFCNRHEMDPKAFSPEFLECMQHYPWPGNVRELIHSVERAVVLAGNRPCLYPKHLPARIRVKRLSEFNQGPPPAPPPFPGFPALSDEWPVLHKFRTRCIASAEEHYLQQLMRHTRGNIKDACRISGLSPSRLHALLKKYDTPRFREKKTE